MTETGQTRIQNRFQACAREGRAALVTFVTAGDPDSETSLSILKALPGAGADIIEFGMPFSDPMAEGPPIQRAALRGLKAGLTLNGTLALARACIAGTKACQNSGFTCLAVSMRKPSMP